MTNKYFDTPPARDEHPRLRLWRSYGRAAGAGGMVVEVRRRQEAFGFGPARLYVDFLSADGEIQRQDDVEWDWDLDSWLIGEGVKARTPANEELRMSLRLRHAFKPVIRDVGEGYFNALVIRAARQGPLALHADVQPLLAGIHENRPYDGGRLDSHLQEVDGVFVNVAHALVDALHYERPVAEDILGGALALYLDERFHVTARRHLFGR